MHRVLVGIGAGLVVLGLAACGESTPAAPNTVVTIIKTEQAPTPATQTVPSQKPAPASSSAVTLPDVVGQRLDVAELHLDDLHIRYREVGGGTFGVVVASNWTVCEQEPAAGASNPGRVNLIVDREC
jgi:hypothetical protein